MRHDVTTIIDTFRRRMEWRLDAMERRLVTRRHAGVGALLDLPLDCYQVERRGKVS